MRDMIPIHNTSMELITLPNVASHMICVHFCKFGVEPSCNFIDFVEATKICTLSHVPTERYLKPRFDANLNAERVVCLDTGKKNLNRAQEPLS